MTQIAIDISLGELADRLSILRLKIDRITDPGKRASIQPECSALMSLWLTTVTNGDIQKSEQDRILELYRHLFAVNGRLWDIENDVRRLIKDNDFGDEFIRLAVAVPMVNAERSSLKQQINEIVQSPFCEVKQYA